MGTTSLRAAAVELLPLADSANNAQVFDVVGNKDDTSNGSSLMSHIKEIERHFHNYEKWFGLAVTPDAELHRADNMSTYTNANVVNPFQIDAGNDNWGAWVQILGSDDTTDVFDLHKIGIVDSQETNTNTFIQIASGASGAAALAAGTYTTIQYLTPTNQAAESAVSFMDRRQAAGTKVWARCLAIDTNTMTLDFYIGLHTY